MQFYVAIGLLLLNVVLIGIFPLIQYSKPPVNAENTDSEWKYHPDDFEPVTNMDTTDDSD